MKAAALGIEEVGEDEVVLVDWDGQVLAGEARRHAEWPITRRSWRRAPTSARGGSADSVSFAAAAHHGAPSPSCFAASRTKRSRRTIEITDRQAQELASARRAAARRADHDFVFTTRDGTPHDHRNIGAGCSHALSSGRPWRP
jgi:hypothetical protein